MVGNAELHPRGLVSPRVRFFAIQNESGSAAAEPISPLILLQLPRLFSSVLLTYLFLQCRVPFPLITEAWAKHATSESLLVGLSYGTLAALDGYELLVTSQKSLSSDIRNQPAEKTCTRHFWKRDSSSNKAERMCRYIPWASQESISSFTFIYQNSNITRS
jgi:hypothetical protein